MPKRGPSRLRAALCAAMGALALSAPAPAAAGHHPHHHRTRAAATAERARLLRMVRRDPRVLRTRAFLRRASSVNFVLPATVRLRTGGASPATDNPNRATLDLGTSLGRREIDLAGTLAVNIRFHDSAAGGALGSIGIDLLPSPEESGIGLRTTSVPLLRWAGVPQGTWAGEAEPVPDPGCGDFTGGAGAGIPFFGTAPWSAAGYDPAGGLPVFTAGGANAYSAFLDGQGPVPSASTALDPATPYVPEVPGVDGLDRLSASRDPGDDALGGLTDPFPVHPAGPGSEQSPNLATTVLRTNALLLEVAQPGTPVDAANPPDGGGPQGAGQGVAGTSGGEANLFGNIPGKDYGIDVTVSLATRISSILRLPDIDFQAPVAGRPWPSWAFSCRQVWTGSVQNHLLGIHLIGNLRISPAITDDGRLRIAKVSLFSAAPTDAALAACLQPATFYAAPLNGSDTAAVGVPTAPLDPTAARPPPAVPCNGGTDAQMRALGLQPLVAAAVTDGDGVSFSGAQASVAGRLSVDQVSADVLLGG